MPPEDPNAVASPPQQVEVFDPESKSFKTELKGPLEIPKQVYDAKSGTWKAYVPPTGPKIGLQTRMGQILSVYGPQAAKVAVETMKWAPMVLLPEAGGGLLTAEKVGAAVLPLGLSRVAAAYPAWWNALIGRVIPGAVGYGLGSAEERMIGLDQGYRTTQRREPTTLGQAFKEAGKDILTGAEIAAGAEIPGAAISRGLETPAGRKLTRWLMTKISGPMMAPTDLTRVLSNRGIDLSLPEIVDRPSLRVMTVVTGQTFAGIGPMERAMAKREVAVNKWLNDILDGIAEAYSPSPMVVGKVAKKAPGVAGAARSAEEALRQADKEFVDSLAQQVSGVESPLSREQVGQTIVDTLAGKGGKLDLLARIQRALYQPLEKASQEGQLIVPVPVEEAQAILNPEGIAQIALKSQVSGQTLSAAQRGVAAGTPSDQLWAYLKGKPSFYQELQSLRPEEQRELELIMTGKLALGVARSGEISPALRSVTESLATGQFPEMAMPWNVAKAARTGIGSLMEAVENAGGRGGNEYRLLSNLYQKLGQSLETSLDATGNENLKALFRLGNEITAQDKYAAILRDNFVSAMIERQNATSVEDIITKLMQKGEETKFGELLDAIAFDPAKEARIVDALTKAGQDSKSIQEAVSAFRGKSAEAMKALRRGAVQFVQNASTRRNKTIGDLAESQLNLFKFADEIEMRPGLRKLLGENSYRQMVRATEQRIESGSVDYRKMLSDVANNRNWIPKLTSDPAYGEMVSRMVGEDPKLRGQVGQLLIDQARATTMMARGGVKPDPLGFIEALNEPTLRSFASDRQIEAARLSALRRINPEYYADKITKDPGFFQRVNGALPTFKEISEKNLPDARSAMGRGILENLANQATAGAKAKLVGWGDIGTSFDPGQFAKLVYANMETVKPFLRPESLRQVEEFADASRRMQISSAWARHARGASVTAGLHTIGVLWLASRAAFETAVGAVGYGQLGLANAYLPRFWVNVMLNPRWARAAIDAASSAPTTTPYVDAITKLAAAWKQTLAEVQEPETPLPTRKPVPTGVYDPKTGQIPVAQPPQ